MKFDKIQPGDVVLLYINTFPQAFLHIMDMQIDPNCVSGIGYNVTFAKLEIPTMAFTWQLNQDNIESGFTMNGVLNTLQLVSRPQHIPLKEKPLQTPKNNAIVTEDSNELF